MQTPETRFHAWFFGLLVGLITGISGWLIPQLQRFPAWAFWAGGLSVFLFSPLGYGLFASIILNQSRKWKWLLRLLLKESYIDGYWVGYIRTSSGRFVMAIEQYLQTPSTLRAQGQSFKLSGDLGAEWESLSADVDPEGPYVNIYYSTTIYLDKAGQKRKTEGFGRLTVDGDIIRGAITDKPELQMINNKEIWIAKGVNYNLRKINSSQVINFSQARASVEWQEMRKELAGISESWVEHNQEEPTIAE